MFNIFWEKKTNQEICQYFHDQNNFISLNDLHEVFPDLFAYFMGTLTHVVHILEIFQSFHSQLNDIFEEIKTTHILQRGVFY